MKTVRLEGQTLLGKNRIREHGAVWKVVKQKDTVGFSSARGPWFLIEAINTGYGRWVHADYDEDFKISKITPCKIKE